MSCIRRDYVLQKGLRFRIYCSLDSYRPVNYAKLNIFLGSIFLLAINNNYNNASYSHQIVTCHNYYKHRIRIDEIITH